VFDAVQRQVQMSCQDRSRYHTAAWDAHDPANVRRELLGQPVGVLHELPGGNEACNSLRPFILWATTASVLHRIAPRSAAAKINAYTPLIFVMFTLLTG
jgi:hypothetical protein